MGWPLLFCIGGFSWLTPSGWLLKNTPKFRPPFSGFLIVLVDLVIKALSLWSSVNKSRLMGWFVLVDFYDCFLLVGSCWWVPIGWLLKQAAGTWGLILQGQASVSCFPHCFANFSKFNFSWAKFWNSNPTEYNQLRMMNITTILMIFTRMMKFLMKLVRSKSSMGLAKLAS